MRNRWILFLGLAFAAACTAPETGVVREAADAMGGASGILAVETLTLAGEGEAFNLGQNKSPDGELPRFTVAAIERVVDYENARWRQEQVRTPTYLTGNPAPQKQVFGIDGDVAYNVSPAGAASRATARTAFDRRAELFHHPIGILREALGTEAQLGNAREEGGLRAVDVTTPGGETYTLYVDESTKLPAKVASRTSHPVLGDVTMETEFSEYAETDGLSLPARITSKLDGNTIAITRVTGTSVNGNVGMDLAAPPDAVSAPTDSPVTVTAEEVSKGIWYLTGQSHHSVVVEFQDHLVLIEAPQSDARALAVIAKARELRPGKPLTHVVATHHHFDHSGGIRAAISEGLTLIAHSSAAAFFEDLASRTHRLEPDALEKSRKPLNLQPVGDEMALEDETMKVLLYPITASAHADTLLMAYFPKEGFLVQADVYSPPAPNATVPPAFPFAANLVENCRTRGLEVKHILPIHGRMMPMKDLMDAAGPVPASD
jgi:glyoxylase-like metal-dependent hydrolase (beta-lactamase superfamily II)